MKIPPPRKYRNRKVKLDGLTFDSVAESRRYAVLKQMQKAGVISGLQTQVPIELVPGVKIPGEFRARPAIRYVADFRYTDDKGGEVLEDVKGMETPVFRLKQHLLALKGMYLNVVRS